MHCHLQAPTKIIYDTSKVENNNDNHYLACIIEMLKKLTLFTKPFHLQEGKTQEKISTWIFF